MAPLTAISEEPCTPIGRLFLRPKFNTTIHCAIGFKHNLNISCIKSAIVSSLMVQHPRFRSILVVDEKGVENWRPTEINIDRHIVFVEDDNNNDDDHGSDINFINDHIADLSVSSPLSTDKPLWEVHVLWAQKCLVFRVHRALGDGISLMSLLLSESRKGEDQAEVPNFTIVAPPAADSGICKGWMEALMGILKMVFYSLVFSSEFVLLVLWADQKTVITGGDEVQLWPRKMVTARFLIDDLNVVKKSISNATINDVLSGVIFVGLSRYLDHWSPKSLKVGSRITGITMVNLRQRPRLQELSDMMKRNATSKWGNIIGVLLLPIYYHKGDVDPLQYVRRVKKMIDRRKQSFVAHFLCKIYDLVNSFWGQMSVACWFTYQLFCNTTFTISNIVGPKQKITIAENPITFIRVNTSGIPHALTMHLTSYAERADMQILAAEDIIPDPEFLAKCFEDALLEMKQAVARSHNVRLGENHL